MKRSLFTTAFMALVLVLAIAAVFALKSPGATITQTAAAEVPVLASPASAFASTAGDKYNFIAIPLDASDSITPFTASGLAAYHGPSVKAVLKWNASTELYTMYVPGISPPPLDFDLEVGGAYFLLLDSSSTDVLSIVGDVPLQGSVVHTLVPEPTSSGCRYNAISIPLDQSDVTDAASLATAIGGVDAVLEWDSANEVYKMYIPDVSPSTLNFAVRIGYPYFVCLNNTAPTHWP